jgi:hypothetical protein
MTNPPDLDLRRVEQPTPDLNLMPHGPEPSSRYVLQSPASSASVLLHSGRGRVPHVSFRFHLGSANA